MATQLTRIELLARMTEALAQQTEQLLASDQVAAEHFDLIGNRVPLRR